MSIRTAVIVGCATGFCTLMAGSAMARTHTPASSPDLLHQRLAGALFRAEGIRWFSSGHCTRRGNPHCTSFEGLRAATFSGLLALKQASRCHLTVSGGTEAGHAVGRYSHHAGYKLDVLPNRCLDHYIPRHFERVPTRGDGSTQYRGPGPVTFAREGSHWDITFGGVPDSLPEHKGVKPPAGPGDDKPSIGRGEDKPMTGRGDDKPMTGGGDDKALMGGGGDPDISGDDDRAVTGTGADKPGTPPGVDKPGTSLGADKPGTPPGVDKPGTPHGAAKPGASPGAAKPGTSHGADKPGMPHGADKPGTPHGADKAETGRGDDRHGPRRGALRSAGVPRAAGTRTDRRHADVVSGLIDPDDDD
ncbi:hypothetical protein NE236_19540 [Actinoallomurus purpureus]|uniref:hypothetical protein n=1 Tax=Actinoallomurus purpureus TaxID=478114 RepID=UPI002093F86C|nr:hypothetical protein [Actinoallomurus purpureus]MCO6007179.1 hypothetical protein [Actinoallomurus purpureus]